MLLGVAGGAVSSGGLRRGREGRYGVDKYNATN